jgi:ABC-type sugar transport system permease subunit
LITGFIETLQVFGPVYILSSVGANSPPGGPANSTMVVAVYQWLVAFNQLNLGFGMAMGMVLFVIILAVTLAQSRLLKQSWEY